MRVMLVTLGVSGRGTFDHPNGATTDRKPLSFHGEETSGWSA